MYKLYSRLSDKETILELWGASTKHPDSVFFFSDFLLCEWIQPESQVISWIYECASKLTFPFHAFQLARWACDFFEEIYLTSQS